MENQALLEYAMDALRRMRLTAQLIYSDSRKRETAFIPGVIMNWEHMIRDMFHQALPGKICKLQDQFLCNYIFFALPQSAPSAIVLLGPYLTADPTREQVLEMAEKQGISVRFLQRHADFYAALPFYADLSPVMSLVAALVEKMWEGITCEIEDIRYEQRFRVTENKQADDFIEQTDILSQMEQMEMRYAHENMLMEIVSKGLTQQAETAMASISRMNFEQRLADPLRNLKNYCIISNTLMRKAAEQGGVHPLNLDRTSSGFAQMIENTLSMDAAIALLKEMVRTYTRLVHHHAGGRYSALVQKTMVYIDANLSGDLGLQALANIHGVAPSYLSMLFHKETGHTLTEWICQQRMKAASQLLKNSRLQIQNVAQLCGFSDPNYFSRLFKRYSGMTPAQFRKTYD